MPHPTVIAVDSGRRTILVSRGAWRSEEVRVAKKDAALRVLRWELDGHGIEVLRAMLAHPDVNLGDAVHMIEKDNPGWSGSDTPSDKKREPEEAPEVPELPAPRRSRAGPE